MSERRARERPPLGNVDMVERLGAEDVQQSVAPGLGRRGARGDARCAPTFVIAARVARRATDLDQGKSLPPWVTGRRQSLVLGRHETTLLFQGFANSFR